jgi:hypothetical protein
VQARTEAGSGGLPGHGAEGVSGYRGGPHQQGLPHRGPERAQGGPSLGLGGERRNETQRKKVTNLLNWLLATDKYGHKHALARRTGIMYIIWNRRMWNTWDRGWESYFVQQGSVCRDPDSGSAVHPHTDHVHFSFSWRGARMNTTYWNPQDSFEN